MNESQAKKIAELDLNQKGFNNLKLQNIVHLNCGYWHLIYICKDSKTSGNNIHMYLIDDQTCHIVNYTNSQIR